MISSFRTSSVGKNSTSQTFGSKGRLPKDVHKLGRLTYPSANESQKIIQTIPETNLIMTRVCSDLWIALDLKWLAISKNKTHVNPKSKCPLLSKVRMSPLCPLGQARHGQGRDDRHKESATPCAGAAELPPSNNGIENPSLASFPGYN